MYVVDFYDIGIDIILKESSGCVVIATKPINKEAYSMSREEYTTITEDKSTYTIRELTDAEEEDLFTDLL